MRSMGSWVGSVGKGVSSSPQRCMKSRTTTPKAVLLNGVFVVRPDIINCMKMLHLFIIVVIVVWLFESILMVFRTHRGR